MLMAPANSRMMFQGMASRSSMSRMPVMKNRMVEMRMTAVLCGRHEARDGGFQNGKNAQGQDDRPHDDSGGDDLLAGDAAQLGVEPLPFSRRPGMVFFSGLKKTMKKPHRRKVISQPMGNMYQVSSKKPMSLP
jgi:hypothetical protein